MLKIANTLDLATELNAIYKEAKSGCTRSLTASRLMSLAAAVSGALDPLYGHTSEDTAYVVDDYPYGFRKRTKIRYWLESNGNKGFRFVAQTMNPDTGRWNAPKKSIYSDLAGVMGLDSKGHVTWTALAYNSSPKAVLDFVQNYPKADLSRLKLFVKLKMKSAQDFASGRKVWTVNGQPQKPTEKEMDEYNTDLEDWFEVSTYL